MAHQDHKSHCFRQNAGIAKPPTEDVRGDNPRVEHVSIGRRRALIGEPEMPMALTGRFNASQGRWHKGVLLCFFFGKDGQYVMHNDESDSLV